MAVYESYIAAAAAVAQGREGAADAGCKSWRWCARFKSEGRHADIGSDVGKRTSHLQCLHACFFSIVVRS